MAFETNIPGYLQTGDSSVIFGTAMLGDTYGEITRLELTRTADTVEEEDANGNRLAVVLTNARFELTIEAVFPSDATIPGLGDQVVVPIKQVDGTYTGTTLQANITGDIKVMWERKGSRKLSFRATHWDALGTGTFAAENPAPPAP